MENNKFLLIPLNITKQGTKQLLSIDKQPGHARIRLFKRKQPIGPSSMGKNLITPKRKGKDTDPTTQNDRLKEYLLNEFRKNSNPKKVISELFVKKVLTFFFKKRIDLENDDTEVHARAVIPKLRRKWEL